MLINILKSLFIRDLNRLKSEIEAYQNEANIWIIGKSIANSAGNLCLHLIGNLNTYIGAEIGKSGYIRHRELEFSLKNIPKAELITQIEATIAVIENALNTLTEQDLESDYQLLYFKKKRLLAICFFILSHIWLITWGKSIIIDGCWICN